jgi:competence protein ComEC
MTAYVLNPDPGLVNPDQNDASVVILFDHGDVEFLFTGDIDTTQEATILARGTPVAAEILKVPHHGSSYGSSAEFLSTVEPEVAIISVGTNSYGHPSNDTLIRLANAGAFVCRTDEYGTIVVNSNGQTYEVSVCINQLFLPIVLKNYSIPTTPPPSQTPTLTLTPTPTSTTTPTATHTPTSTPTFTPTSTSIPNVQITYIFYDGVVPNVESDEYAEVTNLGSGSVDLAGWRLNAGDPGQDFWFPSFLMSPGQSCRVYTNENHPEHCGFNYGRGSAIWSNSGDCGYLYNSIGELVDTYCY